MVTAVKKVNLLKWLVCVYSYQCLLYETMYFTVSHHLSPDTTILVVVTVVSFKAVLDRCDCISKWCLPKQRKNKMYSYTVFLKEDFLSDGTTGMKIHAPLDKMENTV